MNKRAPHRFSSCRDLIDWEKIDASCDESFCSYLVFENSLERLVSEEKSNEQRRASSIPVVAILSIGKKFMRNATRPLVHTWYSKTHSGKTWTAMKVE